MKKSWWKIPLYYVITGLICYLLEFQLLTRFGMLTLPGGAVTPDNTRWLIITGILFVIGIVAGYFLLFRRMPRSELLFSAGITVILNVVLGSLALVNWVVNSFCWKLFTFGWATMLTAWDDFIEKLLGAAGLNQVLTAIILCLLPILFILFGKKEQKAE